MKLFSFLVTLFLFTTTAFTQYSVSTQGLPSTADLSVAINTSMANAKLKIMIGQNLSTSNFSIGFTDNPPDADVSIIDAKVETDLTMVKSRLSNADISVVYGEKIINPDIRIEVVENGEVDYLIYYETENFDVESVLIGLLPLINARTWNRSSPLSASESSLGSSNSTITGPLVLSESVVISV